MIETTVLNYLNNHFEDFEAFMQRPDKLPKSYVLVEKTGGGEENGLRSAIMAVQSISSESLLEAAKLNSTVIDLMLDIWKETNVYSCALNSDYNFTNPTTKEYRYQAVFELFYKEF